MKTILLISLLALSGCASITYSTTKPDGTKTVSSAWSVFSNTAIKGFNADSSTEKTKTGLKFNTSDTAPDSEAMGQVIGAALKTAIKP